MKNSPGKPGQRAGKRETGGIIWFAFSKFFDVLHVFIAMCMSELLMHNAVLGGALYLTGQTWVVYTRLYSRQNVRLLPSAAKASGLIIFVAAGLLSAVLLLVYPALAWSVNLRPLIICIVVLLLRQGGAILLCRLKIARWVRVLLLSVWHTLLSGITMGVLYPLLSNEEFWMMFAMVAGTSLATLVWQGIEEAPPKTAAHAADPDKLQNVSSYRLYNRMVSSVFIALNLSTFTYICYLRYQPSYGMLDTLLYFLAWLGIITALTASILLFFRRKSLVSRYDKPSVFVVGALLFSGACIATYNGWFSTFNNIFQNILWAAGLACMFSVMISLGRDMKEVLELSMGPLEERDYFSNTFAMVDWGVTLSTLLLVLLFTMVSFFMEGRVNQLEAVLGVQGVMRTLMLLLPPLFLVAALVFALMQPLNKDYAKKLAHYRAQQRAGNVNSALETRLQMQLVKKTRYITPGIIKAFLRPFMPCKVIGKEQVNLEQGPVIFVCNHLEVYGPIITNLHLPFYFRSWIVSYMLDRKVVAKQLEGGVDKVLHWLPKGLRKRIPAWIAPLMIYVLNSVDPIPVYRGNVREVVKTIRLTVEAMEYEDNILLFPENPRAEGEPGKYKEEGVSQFFSGFSSIGSEYYKRTGGRTTFYPMYASRKKHTIVIGPGIQFDPDNPKAAEKDRIVSYLYEWMEQQAKA